MLIFLQFHSFFYSTYLTYPSLSIPERLLQVIGIPTSFAARKMTSQRSYFAWLAAAKNPCVYYGQYDLSIFVPNNTLSTYKTGMFVYKITLSENVFSKSKFTFDTKYKW